jgi:deoxyribodipyrimidine photolyase-related protein
VPSLIHESKKTIWVLGDQLNREFAAVAQATPQTHRILMVESAAKVQSKRWHIQRAHFVIASMRRFANELRDSGFEVDYRKATTLAQGLREHRSEFSPTHVSVMEPASHTALAMLRLSLIHI